MSRLINANKTNFLFFLISILVSFCVLGPQNIQLTNTQWLYGNNDEALHQLGWHFFKNDIWRFPLGLNPNYGQELSSSIVYSDSIPLFALFFKLFKFLIPGNFQYFSLWYFVCFYFQLFFSYKILKVFTKSESYSLLGSIFFLIAPIFIFRVNYHGAVAGQWILLFTLYLALTKNIDRAKVAWISLIIFSSLIEYSSMIMIIVIYSILRLFNLKFKKEKIYELVKDFFITSFLLFLTLYIVGYFEIRLTDTLGVGFGWYKLNLLSIFDAVNSVENISWSLFLPDIYLSKGEETEGFNYFGLGQILMVFFALFVFLKEKYKSNIFFPENGKAIKNFIIISILFTLWALTNKISFGNFFHLEIPLNKYIFGVFSILKNTGRIFWIVNYFLLILSIVIIFKCFKKETSLVLLFFFLSIQIIDTSEGLKKRINFLTPKSEGGHLKDEIWGYLFNKYKTVRTTYPIGWPKTFVKVSSTMEKYKTEKTNLVIQARVNRKAAAETRYQTYDNFRKKNLLPDAVYIIDNLNHLRHLKHIFENENVGFFYRDNIWSMALNEKEMMNGNDIKKFEEQEFKLIKTKKKKDFNFNDEDNYHGFGWSHNSGGPGIWSEGNVSSLLLRINGEKKDFNFEINCKPYITKKNKTLEFDIYVNDFLNKKIKLVESKEQKIKFLVKQQFINENTIKIDFKFKNPISPSELFESPDSRKLGFLLKSIEII